MSYINYQESSSNYDYRINAKITNNPSFNDQLIKAIEGLSRPQEQVVLDDGSLMVIGAINQDEEKDKDKRVVSYVKFSIDNGFMRVETVKSSFTGLKSFIKSIDDDDRFKEFEGTKVSVCPVVNTIESSFEMFNEDGISLAHMDFADDYLVGDKSVLKSKDAMLSLTKSHSPETLEVPDTMFYLVPSSKDAIYSKRTVNFRIIPDLSIVMVYDYKDGLITEQYRSSAKYPASTKNPELVEHNVIPLSDSLYYERTFKHEGQDDLNRKIGLEYLKRVKELEREKKNPIVLNKISEIMSNHLGVVHVGLGDDQAIINAGRQM